MRGSVIKRGKTWSVVVDIGRETETGRRQRRWHSGYRTRKEAEQARTEILRRLDTGSYVDPSKQTLGEYLFDEWLPARKPKQGAGRGHRGQVSIGTWSSYRGDLAAYVVPRLGGVRLQALQPAHLDRLYDDLETSGGRNGNGLSAKTVANVHGVLHKALSDALSQGKVVRNVADAVDAPTASRPLTTAWEITELRQFLRHVAADRLYAGWVLFATTGMRRGEVAGLTWNDLDLDAGSAQVTWTLGVVDNRATWKPRPKSKAGERTMSLDPATVDALRSHRARQAEERLVYGPAWQTRAVDWRGACRQGLVFTWPDGSLVHPERWSQHFARHCGDAGLRRIRLHDVRHTYATTGLANASGWHEVKVISERLGHASVGITLDTYSHVLPAADRQTADTLARLIVGP